MSNWVLKTGWSIADGTLKSEETTLPATQQNVVDIGSTYKVVYSIDTWALGSGDVIVKLGTAEGTPRNPSDGAGPFTEYITCAGGNHVSFVHKGTTGSSFDGFIDNVSVKKTLYDKKGSNHGANAGSTVTDDLYGGKTPVIPRSIDNANTVQAVAIGAGNASFNSTDNGIDLGSGATLEKVFSGGGTVMAWIKPDSDGENNLGRVFDKSDSTDHSDGWSVVVSNESSGSADLRFAHGFSGSNPVWDTASREITIGSWNHIAITYDNGATGNDSIIYINGISVTLDAANPSPSGSATDDSSQNLFIGNNTGGERTFDGNICQVGIWDAVLTPTQIGSIMEKTYSELTSSESTNLISYWSLDSDFTDSSGSNNGTAVNDTAITTSEYPVKRGSPPDFGTLYSGRALEFDGVADFIDLGDTLQTWTESETKTMSVWIKNDGNTSESRVFNVGYLTGSGSTAFGFGLDGGTTDNKPFYFLRDTGGSLLKEEFGDVCDTTNWYHFAIVQDGSVNEAYMYQNGVLKATETSVGEISVASPDTAKIGKKFQDSGGLYFNGKICNLQIWDKAWSLSDVQYAYTHPEKLITDNSAVTSGITTSNLKGWYPMTEGAPRSPRNSGIAKIYDGSSDSNHGATTFYGVMSDLLSSAQKTFLGDTLDDTDDEIDFNGNNGDAGTTMLDSDGFTATKATFDRNAIASAGKLINTLPAAGRVSLPIATVAGRTYDVSFDTTTQNSNVKVSLSSSTAFNASNSSGNQAASQTGVNLDTRYIADDTTSFLVIQLVSTTATEYAFVDNIKVYEVGVASGWTTTDAEPLIPQTALMGYSKPMVFDGYANSVNCGIITEITPANNLTVSLWYYSPNFTNADTFFCRRVEDGNEDDSIKLYIYDNLRDESDPLFKRELVLWIWEGGVKYARKVSLRRDSDWHHLVWSWDTSGEPAESKNALYLDGVSQTLTSAASYGNSGSYQSFYIGTYKDHPSTAGFFKGMMNEVAIFNAVLSSTQVQELFNNGVPFDLDGSTLTGSPTLMNYWRNTGASTWTDLKGSDDGTPTGTPETILLQEGVTKGKDILGFPLTHPNNGWLNLEGAEYLDYQDNDLLTFIDGGFSLECWFKMDITPTANAYLIAKQSVDAAANGDDAEYGIWIDTNKKVFFRIQDDSASAYIGAFYNTALTLGRWYHIVCTHTRGGVASSDCKIYLGETDTPTSTTLVTDVDSETGTYVAMENVTDDTPFLVGARSDVGNFFKGSIGGVKVYNRALSAAEITRNYNYGRKKHKG